MRSFPCEYCGESKAVRFGGVCPTCMNEDRKLVREAQKILRQEGGISMEDMAIRLDVSVLRIERWIQEKMIDIKLLDAILDAPVTLGTSADRFLKRKAQGAFTRNIPLETLAEQGKKGMATGRADRGRSRGAEAA